MREINTCPILLASGYDTYSPNGRKYLFDGKKIDCNLDFSFYGEDSTDNLVSNMQNLSISGAQEKYSAVLDGHKIRLANKNEQGTYILKPAPADKIKDRKEIPANEHLTMQIANQAYGIDTAKNGLCFDSNGDVVYITKRYDVTGERKLNQEDFASLTGHTLEKDGGNFKYDGSYSDIANCIKKEISAWMVAMEQFFKLTVFNYIFGNGDAHLKNFSILNTGTENILAPAYDLINTKMHINGDDIGLANGFAQDFCKSDNYEKTGHPCRDDFFRFGTQIGLQSKRVEDILDKFSSFDPKVYSLIYNSFLSTDKHKRNYIRIIEENQKRFVRN
jgi:serine/threonine-protein kinase HipA